MRFEVQTGDRTQIVEIAESRGKYQAVVNGRRVAVNAARTGGTWSLLIGASDAGPFGRYRSYEVTFAEPVGGDQTVSVDGSPVIVRVASGRDRRRGVRRAGSGGDPVAARHQGPVRIAAPMPGRVVKVLVQAGDAVSVRQGVAVVEAMKMENELRAPRAGTVTEVRVAEGALVEANTVLVVIE